jgi:hypothetical protein
MTKNELIDTIEALRVAKHKDLDAELVRDVVTAQADFMTNPNEAYKRIAQAVEAYLARKEKSQC